MTWGNMTTENGGWNGGAASTPFSEPCSGGVWGNGAPAGAATNDTYGNIGEDQTASGGGIRGGHDRGCFNCGEQGHSSRDCPNPAKPRACFNCGEEGHTKQDCTNERIAREFTGECRVCGQQGHRAADCPSRPPQVCNNCQETGHEAVKCENPRKINRDHIEDILPELSWKQIVAAAADRDMDDVKAAVDRYVKAIPETTYQQLEKAFRNLKIPVYLIGLEKENQVVTYTNMDLQGNLDKKYCITWRWDDKHARPKEKDAWPSSAEENMQRLGDAGMPVDRGVPKCHNCDQLGHVRKNCPEEKQENADRVVVQCYNCEEVGHRVRDCPNPRPDKFACHNCKQSGHSSKECPEPRSAEGIECKKCGEVGHFSRDCPSGGGGGGGACHNCGEEGHRKQDCTNPRKVICRNCDEEGHVGKDCPKPRDYSRVQCTNCKQMGHTKVRCKEPLVVEGDAGGEGGEYGGDSGGPGFTSGDGNGEPAELGGNSWGATQGTSGW